MDNQTGPGSCIITGQQPGILTGPLYTFFKAACAVRLARRWKKKAMFWMASEDHDILEVNRVTVNGEKLVLPAGEVKTGQMPQVGTVALDQGAVVDFLKRVLPETEYTKWVMDLVAGVDGSTYGSFFAGLMQGLFPELDVLDPILHRDRTGPVLADLVEKWGELQKVFREGPLAKIGLFEIRDGKRVAVEKPDADEIRKRPADFSPNAALRPIVANKVFEPVAVIGGPTEVKYLEQIAPLYDVAGVKQARVIPRTSATFIEPPIARAAAKAGLEGPDVWRARDLLKNPEASGNGTRELEEKAREFLEVVGKHASGHDRRKKSIEQNVESLVQRIKEDKMAEQGRTQERLRKVADAVTPGGVLQERVENVFGFLNRHGPDLVERTIEDLDPLIGKHFFVWLTEEKE